MWTLQSFQRPLKLSATKKLEELQKSLVRNSSFSPNPMYGSWESTVYNGNKLDAKGQTEERQKTYKVLINKIRELSTSLHQPQDIVFGEYQKDDFRLDNRLFAILSCTWYKLVYIPLDSMLYRLYHFHLLLNPWVFLTNRLN